jgi:hypothetical protein
LIGLNDSFSNVRVQILLMEPLPLFNKIFTIILQDERQRQIFALGAFTRSRNLFPKSATLMSMAQVPFNRGNFRQNSNVRKDKPTCNRCGIVSHTIKKCYKTNGFPPSFKFTRNKFTNGSKSLVNLFVHQVQTVENPHFPFNQTQCQQLMTFMQKNNLAHSTLPAAHQVVSIPNHDHLFVKLQGTSQLPD